MLEILKCNNCNKKIEGIGRFLLNGEHVCEPCFEKVYFKQKKEVIL